MKEERRERQMKGHKLFQLFALTAAHWEKRFCIYVCAAICLCVWQLLDIYEAYVKHMQGSKKKQETRRLYSTKLLKEIWTLMVKVSIQNPCLVVMKSN